MNIEQEIKEVIGSVPEDLLLYLESGHFIKSNETRINCLSFEESKDYSAAMNSIPEYQSLGLWVLDDANDSNPYCYVTKGSCKGAIIHFRHDDEQTIKFSCLQNFLSALKKAVQSGTDIDDIQAESNFIPKEIMEIY